MKCTLLNEKMDMGTIINSIKDTFTTKKTKDNKYLGGSVSEYSKNLIMTFPTMCDNTLPPSTASMISKANERNIVTMLELLFGSIQLNGTDGIEVLSKVHKNIRSNMSLDDIIDGVDAICSNLESTGFRDSDAYRILNEMKIQLKTQQQKSFPVNSLSERSLNDYKVFNIHGKTVVKEDITYSDYELLNMMPDDLRIAQLQTDIQAAQSNNRNSNSRENREEELHKLQKKHLTAQTKASNAQSQYNQDRNRREEDSEKRAQSMDKLKTSQIKQQMNIAADKEKRDKDMDTLKTTQINQQINIAKDTEARDKEMHYAKMLDLRNKNTQFNIDSVSKQLLDSDVKKANEIVPTLMIIKYNELNTDGTIYGQKAFVAGVKSRLISVDSSDIVERLVVKNKTKINFLNFIRATTGEIKLVKDFLLGIEQAKIDAKNSVKKGPAAQMWKVLENRSIKNNLNKLKRKGNDASAITTLVINQETVNIMKKEYDFDIENIKNARMIFDAYNLLGLVIADESIEVVKFLYVGNDTWEQQAYSYLERESNDNSYKKVINLLTKSGR